MEYSLEQYYQDVYLRNLNLAEKALLLKVKEAVSAMTSQTAVLSYDPDTAKAVYKGQDYTVEALSIRNGHMLVHINPVNRKNNEKAVPVKDVKFSNLPVLVRNVIAATRFPECLRKKAETFYGRPIELFGQTLRIMGYVKRENGVRRDHYVFRLDNGDPIALTASEIRKAARQTENETQP